MRRSAFALFAVLALLSASAPLPAQARSLSWPQVTVRARLDSSGALHVVERQAIRLSGDWNGAERTFDLRHRQSLELLGITRIPAAGAPTPLTEDEDLDAVDEYWMPDRSTIRWRARLPSDPPFDDDTLVYELEFVFRGILAPQRDGQITLDHNFAMVDRDGSIDDFRLTLTLDSAWRAPAGFTGEFAPGSLAPGTGYLVTLGLGHSDAAAFAAANTGATDADRTLLAAVLAAAAFLFLVRLVARERALGRFAPVPARNEITREWLDAHLFSRLPEVVGATWDDHTAEAEVAAILARMVQEGKLSNRVTTETVLFFTKQELHLELLVKKGTLPEHERALIDGLFEPHASTTSTSEVRERYKSTGFDPASTIRKPVAAMVGEVAAGGSKPSWKPTALLLLAGLVIMGVGVARTPFDAPAAFATLGISVGAFVVILLFALAAQRALAKLPLALALLTIVVAAAFGTFATVILLRPVDPLGTFTVLGLTLWMLGLMRSGFNLAMSRQSAERIEIRKQLYAARLFFRDELAKPEPALLDAWFPWIIAFGLGRHIDKWFKAFGGASDLARSTAIATATSGSRAGGSGGSGWTGFGGGGGFSGGGSSASFAAAVGGMAASVPSPSSSSSGGSSSGGGSSGGGGGGGW